MENVESAFRISVESVESIENPVTTKDSVMEIESEKKNQNIEMTTLTTVTPPEPARSLEVPEIPTTSLETTTAREDSTTLEDELTTKIPESSTTSKAFEAEPTTTTFETTESATPRKPLPPPISPTEFETLISTLRALIEKFPNSEPVAVVTGIPKREPKEVEEVETSTLPPVTTTPIIPPSTTSTLPPSTTSTLPPSTTSSTLPPSTTSSSLPPSTLPPSTTAATLPPETTQSEIEKSTTEILEDTTTMLPLSTLNLEDFTEKSNTAIIPQAPSRGLIAPKVLPTPPSIVLSDVLPFEQPAQQVEFVNYTISADSNDEDLPHVVIRRSIPKEDHKPRHDKSIAKEKSCSFNGKIFKLGEVIKTDNSCLKCFCEYAPIGHCVVKEKCN